MGVLVLAATEWTAQAQRPRSVSDSSSTTTTTSAPPPTAPQTITVKYEGGVFGYNKKMDGTINFDDANSRLVFRNKGDVVDTQDIWPAGRGTIPPKSAYLVSWYFNTVPVDPE